jgi:hypothetical protein
LKNTKNNIIYAVAIAGFKIPPVPLDKVLAVRIAQKKSRAIMKKSSVNF